jgi:hypothetical protein
MPADPNASRGCGDTREAGGLYLEVGLSAIGRPFESFVLDPVVPLHPDDLLGIPRVGITLVAGPDGITHAIDWVGESFYPFATDFLEEGRRKGFSRKIPPQVELERFEPGKSRVYFLHARGSLHNWRAYQKATDNQDPEAHCRQAIYSRLAGDAAEHEHLSEAPRTHCVRHLWFAAGAWGQTSRHFVDFEYPVGYAGKLLPVPLWTPAYVGCFPITNFTVVKDRDDAHLPRLADVRRRSRLPVLESDR